jgi:geranylgeranyl diphosphate synthase type I
MSLETQAGALIGRYRPIVEEELRRALAQPMAGALPAMMRYHLGQGPAPDGTPAGSGGKRVRAALCLVACEAVGGTAATAAPAAAALELIHGFTLLHDDIADQDELRRGRPTVWKLWGAGQAITAGDAMYALANITAADLVRRGASPGDAGRVLLELNEATLRVCEGQHLDIAYEGRADVSVAEYLEMVRLKTGALFRASLAAGAISGGGTPEQVTALQAFGEQAGVAFQVRDDVLGIWGEEEETGKPVGSDLRQNKRSLPVICALSLQHPVARRLAALLPGGVTSEQAAALAEEMEAAGVRQSCGGIARECHQRAMASLSQAALPEARARELSLLADYLVERSG